VVTDFTEERLGSDVHGDRKGFLGMVQKAAAFSRPLVSQVLKPN